MATTMYYTGLRPVLRGRTAPRFNPFTGKPAVYSNYLIFSDEHVLDGAPIENHVPGTGYHPHDWLLSQWFLHGSSNKWMKNPGNGIRQLYERTNPTLWKGITKAMAEPGHAAFRDSPYAYYNMFFHGLNSAKAMTGGHPKRYIGDINAPASFGYFDPWLYKGVPSTHAMDGVGIKVSSVLGEYGRDRVMEWRGVPSGKAMNV